MFTIQIHILEVLAMYSDGTFADNIHAWGSCFDRKDIDRGLKDLEKEGFVTKTKLGRVNIWHIEPKAIEYCDTVSRRYAERDTVIPKQVHQSLAEKQALAIVDLLIEIHEENFEKMPSETPHNAITDVSETPQATNLHGDDEACPECGSHMHIQMSDDSRYKGLCLWCGVKFETVKPYAERVNEKHPSLICGKCHADLIKEEEVCSGLCSTCLWE